MDNLIVISILGMGGLSFFFAVVLATANTRLKVKEDPRIAEIEKILPGLNCGICGFLNCHEYAVHLGKNAVSIDKCKVGGEEAQKKLAVLLGVEAKKAVKKRAVVHCAADIKIRKKKAEYFGINTCAAEDLIKGGEILCEYGCLGLGDCKRACPFDAIRMVDSLPEINADKCVACGKCLEACPRNIISLEEEAYSPGTELPSVSARMLSGCQPRSPLFSLV
ncbi:MAG: RnfABCDGE type electron transport complex subunit B [Candidatus Omnitrophica bacterium]|nr:RnfABCDGE type electron transport complex subunit B [Candidatus Omnitrophota bacterium]